MNRSRLNRWLNIAATVAVAGLTTAIGEDNGASARESVPGEVAAPGGGGAGMGKGKGKKGKGASGEDPSEAGEEVPGSEEGSEESGPGVETGTFVTITEVRGSRITLVSASGMNGGKGKGKGKSRGGSDHSAETYPVAEDALITVATRARRTGELLIGIEIAGGLENKMFEDEVPARVVREEGRIVEINVILPDDDADAPIAVKPRRPPSKGGP